MGTPRVRIASQMEEKHYHDLFLPIREYLAPHSMPLSGGMPDDLVELTVQVIVSVIKFGYVPTKGRLFVIYDNTHDDAKAAADQLGAARDQTEKLIARLQQGRRG